MNWFHQIILLDTHSCFLAKPGEWTRIYVQNPNGLSIGAVGDISIIFDALRNAEADVMIFPETNLATDQNFFKESQVPIMNEVEGNLHIYHN